MSKRSSSSAEAEVRQQRIRREFSPVRRIAQACINCRRKKARCTGERPKCSNCARLFQDCSYASTCTHLSEPTHLPKVNREDWEQMTHRLDNVEHRLASIDDKLESFALKSTRSLDC
ncbi:hypothetical protein N7467_001892 [Penicillium canescens]|nr:hypothetical protein N7467_001892 [Penicillium canescens]